MTEENIYSTPQQTYQKVERALDELISRIEKAAKLISTLRNENRVLTKEHAKDLETIQYLQKQLAEKEKEIERIQAGGSPGTPKGLPDGAVILTKEEREELEQRVNMLLTRINAHL